MTVNPVYALFLFVAGLVSFVISVTSWRRRPAAGATALAVTMLSMAVWAWTYALFWVESSRSMRFFWLDIAFVAAVLSSPAFFAMAVDFTNNRRWLTHYFYLTISFLPLLIFGFLLSDPWLGLFWGQVDVLNPNDFLKGGPGLFLVLVNGILNTVASLVVLIRDYRRVSRLQREQLNLIFVGMSVPVITVIIKSLGIAPFPDLDLTPITFAFAGIFFALGLFNLHMMDLTPMGRATVMDKMDDGVLVLDHFDRVVDINRKALTFAIPTIQNVVGTHIRDAFPEWHEKINGQNLSQIMNFQIDLQRNAGSYLDVTVSPLTGPHDETVGRLVVWRDISHQKVVDDQLRKFFMAVDQSPSAIMITNAEGNIEYINEQFEALTGYSKEEVIGRSPNILRSDKMPESFYVGMMATINSGKSWQGELINRRKNGDLYWEDQYISPVFDGDGEITHFVSIKQDATQRKQNEGRLWLANENLKLQLEEIERLHAQLREESIRDSLTHLFTRRYMEQMLEREITRASRDDSRISVVMIDIDNFKSINDNHGHFAGDAVLQSLGNLLMQSIRTTDLACRYGGDEIVVVLPNASLEAAYMRAEEWRSAFSLIGFDFEGKIVTTSLSLGVASFPLHADKSTPLLTAADKALYWAKTRKNTVAKYSTAEMASGDYRSDDIR